MPALRYCTLARVRQHARVGIVYDAFWDGGFCRSIVKAMGSDLVLPVHGGKLVFTHTGAFAEAAGVEVLSARHPAFEQSNSMVILDEKLVLKCYRRLRQGINPEIEIGRFLTDVSPYPHIAPVLGALQFCDEAGRPTALAVLQRYVHNQGSGWNYVIEYLRRYLDQQLTLAPDEVDAAAAATAAATAAGRPPLRLPAFRRRPSRRRGRAGAPAAGAATIAQRADAARQLSHAGRDDRAAHRRAACRACRHVGRSRVRSRAGVDRRRRRMDRRRRRRGRSDLRSAVAAPGRSSAAGARGGRATARDARELEGPHRRARTSRR